MNDMHAHVIEVEVPEDKLDEAIDTVRDKLLPRLHKHDGYRGGFLLVNRQACKAEFITWWAYCAAPVELYTSLREGVVGLLSGTPKHTDYEVVVEDQAPTSQ